MAKRRLINWLALIALVCQVVAPSYTFAAAGPRDDGAIPICTANGIVWVTLDEDGRPSTPDLPAEKPCHFCLSQAVTFAPPQAADFFDLHGSSGDIAYLLDGDIDVSNAAAKAQSIRGPPLKSPLA